MSNHHRIFCTCPRIWGGLLCLVLSVHSAQANAKVYDRALASTGWIIVPKEKNSATGTCWLADQQRKLVITSLHITGESQDVLIYFPKKSDGELVVESAFYLLQVPAIHGRVVATDPQRDLALVQLESLPANVKALPPARRRPHPGDDVHSIGNSALSSNLANGTLWRYTRGNVRQVYQGKIRTPNGILKVRLIETQSPVNQGDSGGPVLNDAGELVGVAAAYDPTKRLVSHNIDVLEVQAFLKSSIAKLDTPSSTAKKTTQEKAPKNFPLHGTWKISAKLDDGLKAQGEVQFKADGTYVLADDLVEADSDPQLGRFACANGMLWLIGEEGQVLFRVDWANADRFTGTTRELVLQFERAGKQ